MYAHGKMTAIALVACVAWAACFGSPAFAQDPSLEQQGYNLLEAYIGNATNFNIDMGPIMEVLKDEIHHFVEMRSDEMSTHKLVQQILNDVQGEITPEIEAQADKYLSHEAYSGMMEVVPKPVDYEVAKAEAASGEKRSLAGLGGPMRSGIMIPPGTFVGGSPFLGFNDKPSTAPLVRDTGLRALPAELQAHFNEFYAEYCVQAGINAHGGQYNFPGFDLGSITIEVSKGGCFIQKHSGQLLCDSGFISYSKTPASLNGFSKTGLKYQGSYCPGLTFPKKDTEFSASVGGIEQTVWKGGKK